MNPFKRFFEFVGNPSHTRTLGILAVFAIALSIPLTVKIAQQQQEIRQNAGGCNRGPSLGTFCNNIAAQMTGVSCDIGGNSSAGCPAGSQLYTCYQCTNDVSTPTTPTPATPPPPPPSAPPPSSPSTPTQLSCPGSGIPGAAIPGNIENWGGSCSDQVLNQDKAIAIPNSCSCTVARCEIYSGGPKCWVNNGQSYNDPVGCKNKGASLPDSCFASPPSTCSPSSCVLTSGNICNAGSQCVAVPNQTNCAARPTCPAGYTTFSFPGNNWGCSNTNNPATSNNFDIAPTCPSPSPSPSTPPVTGIPLSCSGGVIPVCPAGTGLAPIQISANGNWACINPSTQQISTSFNPFCPSTTGNETFSLAAQLDGLGNRGDIKNYGSKVFNTPRKTRNITIEYYDSSTNVLVSSGKAQFSYDYSRGLFFATVPIGNVDQAKTYLVKAKVDGFLKKNLGNIAPNSNGVSDTIGFITGDINNDNRLDILDFNQLSGCFGQSGNGACATADLDDNGTVDIVDLNLLIREMSQVQNGD